MNIKYFHTALLSWLFAVVPIFAAGRYDEEAAIREFGVKEGQVITNGFVFINGKYIAPPYIVSTRGTGVFINGYMIEQPCPWPIPVKPPVPLTEPDMPNTIVSNTSKYDKELTRYLGQRADYYFATLSREKALSELEETYKRLPCVQSAIREKDPDYLKVIWNNGETSQIWLSFQLDKRRPIKWTRESVLERTDKDRTNYEDRLSKGDYYFLGSAYGRMTGTADGARMVLSALLPILKTSKDAKEVQQRMAQAGFPFFDERASEAFFNNRIAITKELENRVEVLSKESKSDNRREGISQSSTNSLTK